MHDSNGRIKGKVFELKQLIWCKHVIKQLNPGNDGKEENSDTWRICKSFTL